jgi:putative hydrolase of the HAD superfamily
MSLIRAVIVDLGGVLTMPPSREALARLQMISGFGDADRFLSSWQRHRLSYDLGEVSADEFWRRVGSEGERDFDVSVLAQLRSEDAACWAVPNTALVAWLEALRIAGLRVALLSNIPREQWAALKDGLTWLSLCDVVVLSYELGLAKPNPEVYRRCLEQLSLTAAEVLFVDDRPDNVAAAAALGINAVLFTTVDDLRCELTHYSEDLPLPAASDGGEADKLSSESQS